MLICYFYISPCAEIYAQRTIVPKYELSDEISQMSIIPFYYMEKGIIPSEKKGKLRSTAIILCETREWAHLWIELYIFDATGPEESAICSAFIYDSKQKKYLYAYDFDAYEEVLNIVSKALENGDYTSISLKTEEEHPKGIQYPLVKEKCDGL